MATAPAFIQTIVTSTRIRLARNLAAYPFPQKLTERLAAEVVHLVENALGRLDEFTKNDLSVMDEQRALLLQEQHLVSPALIRQKGTVFLSADKSVEQSISIMVNEEDHLRQQYICKGFDLFKAYEGISGIDEGLAASLQFAYDNKLGYLTACPSNVGTGMRASVMMFLPGLALRKELEGYIPQLKAEGLTVRGVFGEGTAAEGYSYQVSNERTMGKSEGELLEEMVRTTMNLCDKELRAREKLLKEKKLPLRDACLRAYGLLTNCAMLSQNELTDGMVKLKLGMALGFFKARDIHAFNDFLADMRPASFRLENNLRGATERECSVARAEIVGQVLPELMLRID